MDFPTIAIAILIFLVLGLFLTIALLLCRLVWLELLRATQTIAASDSASLILNQITSNNASYLGGILEVAGDSAGIIIANPNGIVCDGCSFANTDKLDLITGTANLDTAGVISDYTTAANDVFIYNANIILREFNVTAGNSFFNWGNSTISADNFNVTAGGHFYNNSNATISADNFNVTAGR